jgi:ornithine decarboxylase
LFDYAREKFNLKFYMLDIGGGYPSHLDEFAALSKQINNALDEHFPAELFSSLYKDEEKKLTIIAEPGGYYSFSSHTLCTRVIGMRSNDECNVDDEDFNSQESSDYTAKILQNQNITDMQKIDTCKLFSYYLSAGYYNGLISVCRLEPTNFPIVLDFDNKENKSGEKLHKSKLWGPTLDATDLILREVYLPKLKIGDYLAIRTVGGYSPVLLIEFNGVPLPKPIYVCMEKFNIYKKAFV